MEYEERVGQLNHLNWNDWNAAEVMNHLDQQDLVYPNETDVLVTEDGRFMRFTIERDDPLDFASWHFKVDLIRNRVIITEAENVKTITFDVTELGLNTSIPLKVRWEEVGADNADIFVHGYTNANPPLIGDCRRGLYVHPGPNSWEWFGGTETLVLHEPTKAWTICP
jgi:hypothetical protein